MQCHQLLKDIIVKTAAIKQNMFYFSFQAAVETFDAYFTAQVKGRKFALELANDSDTLIELFAELFEISPLAVQNPELSNGTALISLKDTVLQEVLFWVDATGSTYCNPHLKLQAILGDRVHITLRTFQLLFTSL